MATIEQRLLLLEHLFAKHLGTQLGASISTPNLPHANMRVDVTYTITNGVVDRTYDADATTLAELADIISTLIDDLQLIGLIG